MLINACTTNRGGMNDPGALPPFVRWCIFNTYYRFIVFPVIELLVEINKNLFDSLRLS